MVRNCRLEPATSRKPDDRAEVFGCSETAMARCDIFQAHEGKDLCLAHLSHATAVTREGGIDDTSREIKRLDGPVGYVTHWTGLIGNRFQASVAEFVVVAGQNKGCGFDGDWWRDPHNPTRRPTANPIAPKRSKVSPIYPIRNVSYPSDPHMIPVRNPEHVGKNLSDDLQRSGRRRSVL